ncbi:MAG: IS1634 family transposase [Opitutaceae bacterium]|nr:IS1634 family transposase [Opitutaceae bacterium]
MFLKRRLRHKDGKRHTYYSVCESLRVHGGRTIQRQLLHLGELNTTQFESWQHTLDVLHEDGSRHQRRLFTDREGGAPPAEDVVEVKLSSFAVKQPRRFGDCWAGCHAWEQLGLRGFWQERLAEEAGGVPWAKVLELLAVNRLLDPRSELYVHEKWFPQTAMDLLLGTDAAVAAKDRLYRCLDRIVAHKPALEQHLAQKWRDLFGATFDVLLYDLTSTYFEGAAPEVPSARRGYSRDHRPDCLQVVLALVVTPEGFPLTYEVFPGNTLDCTTLGTILDQVEQKHGKARRVWVFDRGIVSEDNLALLRARGAHYLVGTPKRKLQAYEQKLLDGPWTKASAEVDVQLVPENDEVYVLCRSAGRQAKEKAMRRRWLRGLIGDLRALRRRVAHGQLKNPDLIQQAIGRLSERHPQAWRWITVEYAAGAVHWTWDREAFRRAVRIEGAYLLRAHWTEKDPAKLWQTYVQLTEAEAAFRTLKSELNVRPIWHWTEPRVEAHLLVAFLGYCLWVYLKKCCARAAPSLTPWTLLDQLRRIVLVEVWFETRDGGTICLPRITQPEPAQVALLAQLDWTLPAQPPPRIHPAQAAPPG